MTCLFTALLIGVSVRGQSRPATPQPLSSPSFWIAKAADEVRAAPPERSLALEQRLAYMQWAARDIAGLRATLAAFKRYQPPSEKSGLEYLRDPVVQAYAAIAGLFAAAGDAEGLGLAMSLLDPSRTGPLDADSTRALQDAQASLASSFMRTKQFDRAIATVGAIADVDRRFSMLLQLADQAARDGARPVYEQVVTAAAALLPQTRKDPDGQLNWHSLAATYLNAGDDARALSLLPKMAEQRKLVVHARLAELFADRADRAAAQHHAREASAAARTQITEHISTNWATQAAPPLVRAGDRVAIDGFIDAAKAARAVPPLEDEIPHFARPQGRPPAPPPPPPTGRRDRRSPPPPVSPPGNKTWTGPRPVSPVGEIWLYRGENLAIQIHAGLAEGYASIGDNVAAVAQLKAAEAILRAIDPSVISQGWYHQSYRPVIHWLQRSGKPAEAMKLAETIPLPAPPAPHGRMVNPQAAGLASTVAIAYAHGGQLDEAQRRMAGLDAVNAQNLARAIATERVRSGQLEQLAAWTESLRSSELRMAAYEGAVQALITPLATTPRPAATTKPHAHPPAGTGGSR